MPDQQHAHHGQTWPDTVHQPLATSSSLDLDTSQLSRQASIPVLIQSHLEDNSGDEEEDQELVAGSSFMEEPDAGEHFMQATSEFFSKMGYWMYNSRFGQIITRDDRLRTKTTFQAEDIWILGICYALERNKTPCSLPEAPRSRKISLQTPTTASHMGESKGGASSIHGSEHSRDSKRGWERKIAHAIASPRATADSDATFLGTAMPDSSEPVHDQLQSRDRLAEKQKEKELARVKKAIQARERELEREERVKEKVRLKDQEKLQKLKAKISLPQFDHSNLREGTRDLTEMKTSESNGYSGFYSPIQSERKSRSIHGYQHERSDVGLGLSTASGDNKQGVIRRMRSISILQKAPTAAMDLLVQKIGSQDALPRMSPERVHQPRSQSISNFSVFSQRSRGTTSFVGQDRAPRIRASSPPPPSLKPSLNVHEALPDGPKSTVFSTFSHLNLNQKKLPDLPQSDHNDIPEAPLYPYQDTDGDDAQDGTKLSPFVPPTPDKDNTATNSKSGKRRMTIQGMFSKDAKPLGSGGLSTLKTFVNASKISLKPKADDLTPGPRYQSPPNSGSTSAAISFGPHATGREGSTSSKKGGVTKNMQHWIEQRLSSNNLHQQFFIASTDEPVPPVSKDVGLSPPGSPLIVHGDGPHSGWDKMDRLREAGYQRQPRSRKKSSIFSATSPSSSSSSTVSSPKSALKSSSSHSPSMNKMRSDSAQSFVMELDSVDSAHTHPQLNHWQCMSQVNKSSQVPAPLSKTDEPPLKSCHQAGSRISSPDRDLSSFTDLIVLPPLPPESPTETFILLEQERNPSLLSLEYGPEGSILVSAPDSLNDTPHITSSSEDSQGSLEQDSIRIQNQRLFDQLAEFSSDKVESFSNLRSEWESLWPSKQGEHQGPPPSGSSSFVHVKSVSKNRAPTLKQENLSAVERERLREIGSAYVKIKNPNLDIVAPRPKAPVLFPTQVLQQEPADDTTETPLSADSAPASPGKPASAKNRLLQFPSALLTTLPRQISPSSPSSTLGKSWRAISPRSPSPRLSLPVISSSASVSSRVTSAQPSSVETVAPKEDESSRGNKLSAISSNSSPKDDEALSAPPSSTIQDMSSASRHLSANQKILVRFMSDFQSRLWFTYRKDMSRIEPSAYTSDAGWGCMMRTGQSLLAQAFVHIMLGREWLCQAPATEETTHKYRTILSWFADEPERCYSIHSITKAGVHLDKKIGEWFGPSTVAHALNLRASDIVRSAMNGRPNAHSSALMEDMESLSVTDVSKALESSGWKPVVVLLPARFGLEKLTEKYISNLKQLFRLPQFLGIAGGRPGRSLYFVANQGNELFYLDPHFVKARATQGELSSYPSSASSYHCNVVRSMDILELDPSMLLGFLIQSAEDLQDLSTRLKNEMERGYPLLTIVEDTSLAAFMKTNQEGRLHLDALRTEPPSSTVDRGVVDEDTLHWPLSTEAVDAPRSLNSVSAFPRVSDLRGPDSAKQESSILIPSAGHQEELDDQIQVARRVQLQSFPPTAVNQNPHAVRDHTSEIYGSAPQIELPQEMIAQVQQLVEEQTQPPPKRQHDRENLKDPRHEQEDGKEHQYGCEDGQEYQQEHEDLQASLELYGALDLEVLLQQHRQRLAIDTKECFVLEQHGPSQDLQQHSFVEQVLDVPQDSPSNQGVLLQRSRRGMKRITKALKNELRIKRQKDKRASPSEFYQYRHMSYDGVNIVDHDAFSIRSFGSDLSL
ncbi:Cysteine protease atg4b [Mortierella claussenii]|nr:Cysteine protease atg4b [Mortierella claussenii]